MNLKVLKSWRVFGSVALKDVIGLLINLMLMFLLIHILGLWIKSPFIFFTDCNVSPEGGEFAEQSSLEAVPVDSY